MRGKTKVSVTVHTDLLREVQRVAGEMSRSAVFEQALAGWLRQRRQVQLDRAIHDYYVSLSAAESAEDAEWAGVGDEAVGRSWGVTGHSQPVGQRRDRCPDIERVA